MPFQAGYNKYTRFKASVAAGYATMVVTGHSWSAAIDALDVTSSNHGGIQALIGGILRGEGTVKGNVLSEGSMFGAYVISEGTIGIMEFYYGYSAPYIVPCMVVKVNHQSAVEGKVEWDLNVRLNTLAGPYSEPI